ncbi:MAG: hypothetical protein KatS3mg100_506 [Candidatus Parcubacteria bacterium]|nr:MAG: hypothetical protein KatS3mg100_506 [Candidatus Parcubacteria bacterium]
MLTQREKDRFFQKLCDFRFPSWKAWVVWAAERLFGWLAENEPRREPYGAKCADTYREQGPWRTRLVARCNFAWLFATPLTR